MLETDEAILTQSDSQKPKMPRILVLSIVGCVVSSSLHFGFNSGVLNQSQTVLERFYNRTRYNNTDGKAYLNDSDMLLLWSLTVSMFLVGGMCGSLTTGYLANKMGRRGTIMLNNIPLIIAYLMMSLTYYFSFLDHYEIFIAGRFLVGVASGIASGLAPMYISEISPPSLKGSLGSLNQLTICVGVLLSNILGMSSLLGTDGRWPFLIGAPLLACAASLCILPFCPESPSYLYIDQQDEHGAEIALVRLRGSVLIAEDISALDVELREKRQSRPLDWKQLFTEPYLRQLLLVSVVTCSSQQLSGINAIIFYSTELLTRVANFSMQFAEVVTLLIGGLVVLGALASTFLCDRLGRRPLLLHGYAGMLCATLLLTAGFLFMTRWPSFAYVSVVSLFVYIAFFSVGPGPIPWMVFAELFTQDARPRAMTISVLANWLSNFLVGFCFQYLQAALGLYCFLPFSAFLVIFLLFLHLKLPETKGRSPKQIMDEFKMRYSGPVVLTPSAVTGTSFDNVSRTGPRPDKLPLLIN